MKNLLSRAMASRYDSRTVCNGLEMVFAEHCTDLARLVLSEDAAHQAHLQEMQCVYDAIADRLSEPEQPLLHQFEHLHNIITANEFDLAYLQGYLDCVTLLRHIQLI